MKYQFLRLSLKSNRICHYKLSCLFRIQKNYFFFLFYTHIFTKYLYQFIYSTHLFNKIFISFTNYFLFPHLLFLSLTDPTLKKNTKILNAQVTVIVHIYTVTVTLMHFIHNFTPIDVGFFFSKCVKWITFCILQNFTCANVVALKRSLN